MAIIGGTLNSGMNNDYLRVEMPPAAEELPGIGVLNEKSVHHLLKSMIEPDVSCHEVKLGRYIVDVLREDGIYEIQSRHFYKLINKLTKLLETHKVTIVYPVIRTKWIVWVDEDSGRIVRRRKSPKTGRPCHILSELYGIRGLLAHENLSFIVAGLDAEEYRGAAVNKGPAHTKKGRLWPCIPLTWLDLISFGGTIERGLGRVIPELPAEFTSLEFGRGCGMAANYVHRALGVLRETGLIECVGKRGARKLYRLLLASGHM